MAIDVTNNAVCLTSGLFCQTPTGIQFTGQAQASQFCSFRRVMVNGNGGVTFGNIAWSTLGGTGGLLMIITGGNVTVGATGSITANGISQNNTLSNGTYTRTQGGLYGSGGASGAGAIVILHKGTYSNSGTVQSSGGSGQDSSGAGGNGGVFTETID